MSDHEKTKVIGPCYPEGSMNPSTTLPPTATATYRTAIDAVEHTGVRRPPTKECTWRIRQGPTQPQPMPEGAPAGCPQATPSSASFAAPPSTAVSTHGPRGVIATECSVCAAR